VGAIDQLVANMGLYAVRPDLQRLGVGNHLLSGVVPPVLRDMKVPFGLGAFRPALRRLMMRLDADVAHIMPDLELRSIDPDRVEASIEEHIAHIYPIMNTMDEWPTGRIIDLNGFGV
jgi:nodulation protein A